MSVKSKKARTTQIVGAVLVAAFATLAAGCNQAKPISPAPVPPPPGETFQPEVPSQ